MSTPGELLEALGREARARFGGGNDPATRVYRGRSVDELVPQIQRDLGSDAIIVRRREGLTGGVLGFFQRQYVEIEAMPGAPGVDLYDEAASAAPLPPEPFVPDPPPAPEYRPAPLPPTLSAPLAPAQSQPGVPAAPPPQAQTPSVPTDGGYTRTARPAPEYQPIWPTTPEPVHASAPPPATGPVAPPPFLARESVVPPAKAGSAYVTAHLAALARADRSKLPPRTPAPRLESEQPSWSAEFEELSASASQESFLPRPPERSATPRHTAQERRVVAPGSQARARAGVARSLQRCGIGEQLINELIDGASAHALALAPRGGLAQAVRATLAQRIPVAPPLPTTGAAIVVVGAGGAGKTACCAALLGAYRTHSSLSVSFATITREPSRGELRMLLSPYVMKPSAAAAPRALRALRRARNDGIAVLDTPNVSPSERTGVRELAKLLAEMQPERVVVALPATLGATAAAQLLQALKPLGANALAITHADETDQLGVAVEAACRFALAPEYMLERARAGGWRLRPLTPAALAERLLP